MTSLRAPAESLKHDILMWQRTIQGGYPVESNLTTVIEKALVETRNDTITEVAQFVEDDRYNLAGREAEWSRFIAHKIRALKSQGETPCPRRSMRR